MGSERWRLKEGKCLVGLGWWGLSLCLSIRKERGNLQAAAMFFLVVCCDGVFDGKFDG